MAGDAVNSDPPRQISQFSQVIIDQSAADAGDGYGKSNRNNKKIGVFEDIEFIFFGVNITDENRQNKPAVRRQSSIPKADHLDRILKKIWLKKNKQKPGADKTENYGDKRNV